MSGGILLDQGIHMIDVCNWASYRAVLCQLAVLEGKKEPSAMGTHGAIFRWPINMGDINVSLHCSQVGTTFGDVCARFVGTKGIAEAHYSGGVFIEGVNAWDSGILRNAQTVLSPDLIAKGATGQALFDSDKNKGQSFIQSIESGNYLNQTAQGSTSTLSAIMGRNSAITNREITMEEVRYSDEHLDAGINWEHFDRVGQLHLFERINV